MKFDIQIEVLQRYHVYTVEQTEVTDQCEYYSITGHELNIIVRNNRPLLLAKNLKQRRPHWALKSGACLNMAALEKMFDAIEGYFRSLNNPKRPHPKNG